MVRYILGGYIDVRDICGLYYKHITIINDTIISDARIWRFILQSSNMLLEALLTTLDIVNYNRNHVYSTGHILWHHLRLSFTIVIYL